MLFDRYDKLIDAAERRFLQFLGLLPRELDFRRKYGKRESLFPYLLKIELELERIRGYFKDENV